MSEERQDRARSQEPQGWAPGNEASSALEASLGPRHRPWGFALEWSRARKRQRRPLASLRPPGAQLGQVEAPHQTLGSEGHFRHV